MLRNFTPNECHHAGEGREVEALESEFLESLHETRELEADLSAALRPLLDPQVLVFHRTPQSVLQRHARTACTIACADSQ